MFKSGDVMKRKVYDIAYYVSAVSCCSLQSRIHYSLCTHILHINVLDTQIFLYLKCLKCISYRISLNIGHTP